MANHAALSLFSCEEEEMIGHQIGTLLPSFNFSKWVEGKITRQRENIVMNKTVHLARVELHQKARGRITHIKRYSFISNSQ